MTPESALALDNDYLALCAKALWLGTDYAYKAAVESIARKRAALSNAAAPTDKQPDYTKAERTQSLTKVARAKFDEAAWTARTVENAVRRSLTLTPEVLASGVEFHFNQDTTYYLDTDGTELRYRDDVAWVFGRAEGQTADGMVIRDTVTAPAFALAKIPSDTELETSFTGLARNVQALLKAPLGESFAGPALFEPQAAAQLLAQLLGDNLRIPRKPISDPNRPVNVIASEFEGRTGSRVLPEWLDVVDDATQTAYQSKELMGYYPFPTSGGASPPQPVALIEKGVLKTFLTTRQPAKNLPASNGHARFPVSFGMRAAAIGNLFVKAAQTSPLADLKARLIQMCKDRDKPYGLLIRKLDFPFSGGNAEMQTLQTGSANSGGSVRPVSPPTLMYRVYPDGREELVRGMRFRGLSTRSLRDILGATSETAVFDYINNGAPLARSGVAGYIALTSVISPGLLFDELEVERTEDQLQKPALVPPPDRTANR